MAGYEPGDANWAPPPAEPFSLLTAREPRRLLVGLTLDMPVEGDLDPVCERGARDAADLLASLGHEVSEVPGPWRGAELLDTFSVLWAASVALSVAHGQLVTGRAATEENVEPLTWALYQKGLAHSSVEFLGALAVLQGFSRGVVAAWGDLDVLVTPALAKRPVKIGEIDTCSDDPMGEFMKAAQFTPYTAIVNVTGQPAISLPLLHGEDGLPLGVQLVGPPAGEALLLALANQLEEARPWADRVPPEPVP
jgi:amidase